MIDPKEAETTQEFESKIRFAFPIQDPDQVFIDRLQKTLAEKFEDVEQPLTIRRPRWLDKFKLVLSPLAWGTIGLIMFIALIWGIKTLIPVVESSTSTKATPTPEVSPPASAEATQVEGDESGGIPPVRVGVPEAWPVEPITRENAYKVTDLSLWGRGTINGIAWSPDGTTIAVASSTGISLYNAVTYEETNSIASGSSVYNIVYSPDGAMLAAELGFNLTLFDVTSGEAVRTLSVQRDYPASSLAYSPDGKLLASGYDDSTIKIWDINSGEETISIKGTDETVGQLGFYNNGATLVSLLFPVTYLPEGTMISTGEPATVKLWDVSSGTELRSLDDCRGYSLALSPDENLVAVKQEGYIAVCDLKSGALISKQEVDAGYTITFSPDGTLLAGAVANEIKLWDVATGDEVRTLNGHEEWPPGIAFSPDGSKLVSVSSGSATIWDISSGQELHTFTGSPAIIGGEASGSLEGFGNWVAVVAFSPDGKMLATVSEEGPVMLYYLATGELLAEFETEVGFIYCLEFSPDSNLIAVGGGRYAPQVIGVQVWDVATHEQRLKLDDFSETIYTLAFSPDGKTLFTGEGLIGGSAKMWDLESGEMLDQFGRPREGNYWGVHDLEFSPDGSLLAIGSEDGSVMLWDVAKRMAVTVLHDNTAEIMNIAFSPNGKVLASSSFADNGGETSELRLWNIDTGKTLYILQYSPGGIAFNADGRVLASTSYDGTARLWDVETGKSLAILDSGGMNVVFSPDGTLIAAGGNVVRLWGIAPASPDQGVIIPELSGGGATPTPQLPAQTPEDIGIERIPLPVLLTGEEIVPGAWSPDGSYFYYYQSRYSIESGLDQATISLSFLEARTGATCESVQETVKMVDSEWGMYPEGSQIYERVTWMSDHRLLYINPNGELMAITPCDDGFEDWSASLPFSNLSFPWGVYGNASAILIKGEQAYWLFTPSTQRSIQLGLPSTEESLHATFAWSPGGEQLVSSRVEDRQGELWIIFESIDLATGDATPIYEVRGSQDLQSRYPYAPFFEWAGDHKLFANDTEIGMILFDISSQPVQSTILFPDLFGFELPAHQYIGGFGVMPGAELQDYHLILETGMGFGGQFYLYHPESGVVDQLTLDPPLLVVDPRGKSYVSPSLVDSPPQNETLRVIFVDSNVEPIDLSVKGHVIPQNLWQFASILPGGQRVLFISIQGISIEDLQSSEIISFWEFEGSESFLGTDSINSYISPDGKTVVVFATMKEPIDGGTPQAMYWLRLDP
jgi:WD40 repeat protein